MCFAHFAQSGTVRNIDIYRLSLFSLSILFALITKEKGTLIMVEKLCSRLKESRTDAVAQKCAYCLTLLTHSEKTVRRLIDHTKEFKGKFQVPEVHGSFTQLIAKASKVNSNPMKVALDELSAKVEECLRINEDGEEVTTATQPAASQANKGRGKGAAANRAGRKKHQKKQSYSDESEEENVRPRKGRARAAKNVSDSE